MGFEERWYYYSADRSFGLVVGPRSYSNAILLFRSKKAALGTRLLRSTASVRGSFPPTHLVREPPLLARFWRRGYSSRSESPTTRASTKGRCKTRRPPTSPLKPKSNGATENETGQQKVSHDNTTTRCFLEADKSVSPQKGTHNVRLKCISEVREGLITSTTAHCPPPLQTLLSKDA